jgi:RNA polymerase sigma-70 factor (ECF subfamily)
MARGMDVSGDDRSLWLATYIVPHESALRDWLSRLAGIAADQVDDLVQETYAVLATRADVSGIQNPRAYAFQVARSILLQQLRRARVVTLGTLADLDQLGEVADLPTPEQHAVARDEYARVVQAIAQMPLRRVAPFSCAASTACHSAKSPQSWACRRIRSRNISCAA